MPAPLIDNSAWARLGDPRVPASRREELAELIESGELLTSLPLLLEAGYSARGPAEHEALMTGLDAMRALRIDERAEARAVDAQSQLARAGHHRIPPVDLIIAALADLHGCGVLHYDAHYDVILERTDLSFGSEWLLDRGSL